VNTYFLNELLKTKMPTYDFTFKILLLGDNSVGKQSLTKRYCYDIFNPSDNPSERLTIGVDFHTKTIELHGKKIKLQIWDFGGEERYRFLLHQYCKGSNAAIFLYDITNRLSLDHLPDWTHIIREHSGDIPIMLIGSKLDLEEYRAISREEGILAAKKYNLSGFKEVSAKTGQNVNHLFEDLIEILIERYPESQKVEEF